MPKWRQVKRAGTSPIVVAVCFQGLARCSRRVGGRFVLYADHVRFHSCHPYTYKWKNHFYEMKGDVGMSLHEKGRNKKCLHQDTKSLITPSLHLCFALTCCLFVCYECIRQSKQHNILTSNCLHENVCCSLGRNKDVGMRL